MKLFGDILRQELQGKKRILKILFTFSLPDPVEIFATNSTHSHHMTYNVNDDKTTWKTYGILFSVILKFPLKIFAFSSAHLVLKSCQKKTEYTENSNLLFRFYSEENTTKHDRCCCVCSSTDRRKETFTTSFLLRRRCIAFLQCFLNEFPSFPYFYGVSFYL